jgi:hypothetical protein
MAILTKIFNFLKLHWKVVLAAILGAVFFAKAQGCYHKVFPSTQPISGPTSPTTQPTLPKNDKEQVIVKNNQVQIVTSKGTQTVSGSRGVTVDIRKDDTVKVTPKIHGWVLNPMIGFAGNNTGIKGTLGAEFYFYKKLDFLGGLGADKYFSHTALFVGSGYTPENQFFHNTSFWIGGSIDVKAAKSVIAGISVRI